MTGYFGYIRVSTLRQGMSGVSLAEQKAAIETYASRNGLKVTSWFEERETAAKRGRRMFAQMMADLARGKGRGVIIHKIDRSARNLRDWADLGELIDKGIDVHFAHDALDLRSRGGRLSADIQAVVAADFIRNLREETRKGFYGRLKQGLYPLRAPIGYLDTGRGKPKEIDPIKGPLVRLAFELYATEEWNFHTLRVELERRGLRGNFNTSVSLNGLTTIFNNPFYFGLIHIRKTNEVFEGIHQPLIPKSLYDRVQRIMRERRHGLAPLRSDFVFRRIVRCGQCNSVLIGERQKGRYIYYRCHRQSCRGTIASETALNEALRLTLRHMHFSEHDFGDFGEMLLRLRASTVGEIDAREKAIRLQIAQCEERLSRLTDALIDSLIDKDAFDHRKASLLAEKYSYSECLRSIQDGPSTADIIEGYLELIKTAERSLETEDFSERRNFIRSVTSNYALFGKQPVVTLKTPYKEIAELQDSNDCDLERDDTRTLIDKIFMILKTAAEARIKEERAKRGIPSNDNKIDIAA